MRLDLGSFAFNFSFEGGGGTPSWGTALGQGEGYKITCEDRENIILGMTRQFYPKENVYCPLGKGGTIFCGRNTNEMQQVALFKKVYVNDKFIGYPFILLLQVEDSEHHKGRLALKYSPKIFIKENDDVLYSNEKFIEKVYAVFEISNEACWFVYDINVEDQETLRFSAVLVDKNNRRTYKTIDERRQEWTSLIPSGKKSNYLGTINANNKSLQLIFYGAPGTGKSYRIKEEVPLSQTIRTTFHPDSDYSTFVGAYKPTMQKTGVLNAVGKEEEKICYSFVPQAFLKAYVRSWKEYPKPVFLVIEEINRGNCAQIFGDLFQLLDRNAKGFSDYPIDADDDIRRYLADQNFILSDCDIDEENKEFVQKGEKLMLPNNLFIWATMNTSDQSLFPIDSAFKRRWDWEYEPLKYNNSSWVIDIDGKNKYPWVEFQKEINRRIFDATHSEDKMLGDYFVNPADGVISASLLKNKVLFYLWNDVCKDGEGDIFRTSETADIQFSDLYKDDNNQKLIEMMNYLLKDYLEKQKKADKIGSESDLENKTE
ncbi:MAG: hypothetical protein LUC91_11475 [Prevotella sp.]|nr:hypothetical protein [Prevotella sp.]